jgi:hypothetical protein
MDQLSVTSVNKSFETSIMDFVQELYTLRCYRHAHLKNIAIYLWLALAREIHRKHFTVLEMTKIRCYGLRNHSGIHFSMVEHKQEAIASCQAKPCHKLPNRFTVF